MKDESSTLRRRDFLSIGAAGLTTLLASAASPVSAAAALGRPKPPPGRTGPITVGYWTGSDRFPTLDWDTAKSGLDPKEKPSLTSAASLRRGDVFFESVGVLLTIHGLYPEPDPETLAGHASVLFDIIYQPAMPAIYRAWNLRGGPNPNISSRVKLRVPVDEDSRSLLLRGELQGYGTGISPPKTGVPAPRKPAGKKPPVAPPPKLFRRLFDTRLTVADEKAVPKLVRGFYLIGLPTSVDGRPPAWGPFSTDWAKPEYTCLLISAEYGDVPR
jgi:hypothetical protein